MSGSEGAKHAQGNNYEHVRELSGNFIQVNILQDQLKSVITKVEILCKFILE